LIASNDCISTALDSCIKHNIAVCLNVAAYIGERFSVFGETLHNFIVGDYLSYNMSNELHLEDFGREASLKKGVYKELRDNPYLLGLSTLRD
jgi:hypothetical protein